MHLTAGIIPEWLQKLCQNKARAERAAAMQLTASGVQAWPHAHWGLGV